MNKYVTHTLLLEVASKLGNKTVDEAVKEVIDGMESRLSFAINSHLRKVTKFKEETLSLKILELGIPYSAIEVSIINTLSGTLDKPAESLTFEDVKDNSSMPYVRQLFNMIFTFKYKECLPNKGEWKYDAPSIDNLVRLLDRALHNVEEGALKEDLLTAYIQLRDIMFLEEFKSGDVRKL